MVMSLVFQFTLKITVKDSDDSPIKDSYVVLDGDNDGSTKTGDDGATTNNDQKFEFGSKVTMTVTMAGYFTKKEEHEFTDSDALEQEHTIKLTTEGKYIAMPTAKSFYIFGINCFQIME